MDALHLNTIRLSLYQAERFTRLANSIIDDCVLRKTPLTGDEIRLIDDYLGNAALHRKSALDALSLA